MANSLGVEACFETRDTRGTKTCLPLARVSIDVYARVAPFVREGWRLPATIGPGSWPLGVVSGSDMQDSEGAGESKAGVRGRGVFTSRAAC